MGRVRDREGVVLRVDRAAVLVGSGGAAGPVRASWGGGLLAAVAADPAAAPRAGDTVCWREWPDGRRTVERVVARGPRAEAGGQAGGAAALTGSNGGEGTPTNPR